MSATATGVLDSAKEYLNPQGIMDKLHLSRQKIFELGIYFGIGFLLGFLIKKYAKFLFAVAATVVAIVALQQFDVVTVVINWDRVQELFGIQYPNLDTDIFTMYWEWIKVNMGLVLSLSIGFILGYKAA